MQIKTRPFAPGTVKILELMKRFGDAQGYVDYDRLPKEQPDWKQIMHGGDHPLVKHRAGLDGKIERAVIGGHTEDRRIEWRNGAELIWR